MSSESSDNRFTSTAIAGILAGVIPKFVCHPIDTVKANLQINKDKMSKEKISSDFKRMGKLILKERGIKGFFPGVGILILGSAPAGSLYFSTYEIAKTYLSKWKLFGGAEWKQYLAAGMVAETVSCILWLPIDVIKERLQVQKFGYKNSIDAFRKIIESEGVQGIYRVRYYFK